MDKYLESLEKFGLAQKEAQVYLANLELGNSTASDISLKSNLPRTLVYDILERLIDIGLVSYAVKDNKKYFNSADPHELIRILKEKEEAVKEVLPGLEKLQKMEGIKRPKVEVYEGNEGMKAVMNDILRSGVKEFLSYGSSRSSFDVIPAFMQEWHKERIKRRIVMKIIYNRTKEAMERVKEFGRTLGLANYKFMPIELESPTATLIYGSKVILQSWTKEPFAVVIENAEMALNQKKYFEKLWGLAKK